MATPFLGVPTPGGEVQVPIVDFKAIGSQLAAGIKDSGTWADKTATEIAGFGDLIGRALEYICGRIGEAGAAAARGGSPALRTLATCIDSGLSIMLGLQTAMQGEGTTGFFQFLASLLSDLLGVEVSAGSMQAAFASGGRVAGMEAAGKGLSDLLIKELTASQEGPLQPSTAGVETFLGFVLAFTVREANIEFLSSLAEHIPIIGQYLKFDDSREYAVRMAENLGLGRMTRLALRPLFNVLAVNPATWALNQRYRPTHFKEADVIRFAKRGIIDRPAALTQLAQLGYSDADSARLLDELLHGLAPDDLIDAEAETLITRQQSIDYLVGYGWTADEAKNSMAAADRRRLRPHYRTILDHVFSGVVGGFISVEHAIGLPVTSAIFTEGSTQIVPAQVGGIVGRLYLSDAEKQVIAYAIQVIGSLPRALLTVTELKTAWQGGYIDLEMWTTQMRRHGYDDDSLGVLMEEMLLAKPQFPTNPAKKEITLADAKKALKTGIWTLQTFKDYLKTVGYTTDAINSLVLLYGPTAASSTPAAGFVNPLTG